MKDRKLNPLVKSKN